MPATTDIDTSKVSDADLRCRRALATCKHIIENRIPNLLRLYPNPWVAQTCLTLNHYAQALTCSREPGSEECPSFLANSREEALSGAIKLARCAVNGSSRKTRSPTVIIVDSQNRFPHFGCSIRDDGSRCQLVPGVEKCHERNLAQVLEADNNPGIVVLADGHQRVADHSLLRDLWINPDVITIRCVDTTCTTIDATDWKCPKSDIIVFDESFVDFDTAFAAFSARKSLFATWWTSGMSMFHSTTFQPNTFTTMHFMTCLRKRDPATARLLKEELDGVVSSMASRHDIYRRLYSPSLSKLISVTGFDLAETKAAGHILTIGRKKIFDGVAGVACSLRGHNPESLPAEIRDTVEQQTDLFGDVSAQLNELAGLPFHVPAVSGAAAVEHALQIALSVQPERPHVLALKGGFGGKTLGALTGTSRVSYKRNIGPLYPEVTYIDPFSATAARDFREVISQRPVGVVQVELIQGVGGVRVLPMAVVDALRTLHTQHDFLLFVDETQTGMFRTGSFVRSSDVGIRPDILTIGKGTSDTMFPFAATLYSERVHDGLQQYNSELAPWLTRRYFLPASYAALLNTLRRSVEDYWPDRVRRQGDLFQQELTEQLKSCRNVTDVRVFGMLIGIELNRSRLLHRLLGSNAAKLYSLAMINHPTSPVLMGFSQYEPHVFKLTPGLLMKDEDIRTVSQTIGDVLNRSPISIAYDGLQTIRKNVICRSHSAPHTTTADQP